MIDSKTKNQIVAWMVELDQPTIKFQTKDVAKAFNVSDNMVRLFLKQLDSRNLITYSELGMGYVLCEPTMDFYDFHRMGGFTAIEDGLLKNIEKLDLELKQLKSEFPEKVAMFANATTILSAISSAATGMFGYFFK
ncbi:MAG: hypothetical protein II060_03535 [Bacteroidales bacterium]|nr:hypothetical protein [Bacteroidales bacterium]